MKPVDFGATVAARTAERARQRQEPSKADESAAKAAKTEGKRPAAPLKRAGISIEIVSLKGEQQIRSYAQRLGRGTHLTLSQEFYDWMQSGGENYEAGIEIIDGVLRELSTQVGIWSAQEGRVLSAGAVIGADGMVSLWADIEEKEAAPWNKKEDGLAGTPEDIQGAKATETMKMKSSGPDVDLPTIMALLARANTRLAVQDLLYKCQVNHFQTKLAMANPDIDKSERDKIALTMAKLKKVIGSAKKKIKKLTQEEEIQRRQEKAEREYQQEKADRLSKELRRRRDERMRKEHMEIFEPVRVQQSGQGAPPIQPITTGAAAPAPPMPDPLPAAVPAAAGMDVVAAAPSADVSV